MKNFYTRCQPTKKNVTAHLESLGLDDRFYVSNCTDWDEIDNHINLILQIRGRKYFGSQWKGSFENYDQVLEMVDYYKKKKEKYNF